VGSPTAKSDSGVPHVASPPDDEPPSAEDIAYVAERAQRCREILDRAAARRRETMREGERVPRREPVPGRDWCYRCAGGRHLITEADHRPVWPLRPSLNRAPPVPINNWPPQPCDVPDPIVLADGSVVWGEDAAEWQEAAE
jgi:hypothetical protein